MTFTSAIKYMLRLAQNSFTFEAPPIFDPETVLPDHQPPKQQDLDWGKILVVFTLASAIDIALLSVRIHSQKLPLVFYFLELAILLAFSGLFISRSVRSNCPLVARGIFFGVTAFFISITIPFPALWFKCVACFVYAVSWIAILICNCTSYSSK